MTPEGWIALTVIVVVFAALAVGRWPAYLVLWCGLIGAVTCLITPLLWPF